MTPKTKGRLQKAHEVGKKGLSLAQWPIILTIIQQLLVARGEVAKQTATGQTTASSVAAMVGDISVIKGEVKGLQSDVRWLKSRPGPQPARQVQRGTASSDTVAVRPGFGSTVGKAAGKLLVAPFRFLGSVFKGG